MPSEMGITWIFNPPCAPNFGGLWEADVKSVKTHLKKTMGARLLTLEEMTQIEAILNSRPLCELSSNPKDLQALTHLRLAGRPLVAHSEVDVADMNPNRSRRWQLQYNRFNRGGNQNA